MAESQPTPSTSLGDGAMLKAALAEAHKLINDLISAEMGALGLNLGEGDVLTVLYVAEHDPSPSEVADWLSVTGASTTARLQSLERRGLIERKPNPQDKRSVSLHLTSQGRKLARQVIDAKDAIVVHSVVNRLGPRKARQLTKSLEETAMIARELLAER